MIRSVAWIAWGATIACGSDRAVESSAGGVLARGLVREVACDGDDASLTIDSPGSTEPLAVILDPEADVDGEPLAPGCEGLGRTLGRQVEVEGRIAEGGAFVASRVEPAG